MFRKEAPANNATEAPAEGATIHECGKLFVDMSRQAATVGSRGRHHCQRAQRGHGGPRYRRMGHDIR